MKDTTTYTTGKGRHAYDVEVIIRSGDKTERQTFSVYANNRDQAARRVEKDGYEISSVNMVG